MTNNNNRSADDVIVFSGKDCSTGNCKENNLSELAEEMKRKQHGEFCKCSKISDPDDFYCDCGMVDYNCALDEFLSKIREAMR